MSVLIKGMELHGGEYSELRIYGDGNVTIEMDGAEHKVTDEELAGIVCTGCPPKGLHSVECGDNGSCYNCWLDWLKPEVDSDPT